MFGSGDDAFVVEPANLPLAETKNIQQNFVGMLTQPRCRLRWQPRKLAEVEGRGRHQICPDAGLFHHAEHWIVTGTVGVVFHGFPHRPIRAPGDTLLLEDATNFCQRSSVKPGLQDICYLPASAEPVALVTHIETQTRSEGIEFSRKAGRLT